MLCDSDVRSLVHRCLPPWVVVFFWPSRPGRPMKVIGSRSACSPMAASWCRPTRSSSPPATQITFPGRPVDLALADDGKTLVVKNISSLVFIDVATAKVKQTLELYPGRPRICRSTPSTRHEKADRARRQAGHRLPGGFSVVGLLVQGDRVFATDSQNHLRSRPAAEADGRYHGPRPSR